MRIGSAFTSAVMSTICSSVLAVSAQAGFCSHYEQTWSNAGQCADCQLNIKHWADEQAYTVRASNGWQAELKYVDGDSSVATGGGTWRNGLGHAYSGKNFDIDLNQQGQTLSMTMSTYINGQQQGVRASFICTG